MARSPKDVTAAELAILEKLWENEGATLKQMSKWLYGAEAPSDIATVQKLVSRFEAKEFVQRNRNRWPHEFRSLIDRDQLITHRLQTIADQLSDGTMSSLLVHLIKGEKFNARQRKRLRRLLDEVDAE